LHLGGRTRSHADLDIGCFRNDLAVLRRDLGDWEFYAAIPGTLKRLGPEERPPAEANSLWCHSTGTEEWWLEILLDERDGPDWVFRRCRRVKWPTATLALRSPGRMPYLRPEIQLLYKAKASRAKDDADFERLLPALSGKQLSWLGSALETWEPGHRWIPRLRRAV